MTAWDCKNSDEPVQFAKETGSSCSSSGLPSLTR